MEVQGGQSLGVLWGKSKAPTPKEPNLLLQHLLDTAAVAELIWDLYLAATVREKIDACCGGTGRKIFSLVCGLHDVGKATPAFQAKDATLADRVRAVGLDWKPLGSADTNWHHTYAGAVIVKKLLANAGWGAKQLSWIVPLIAGHHGMVPDVGKYQRERARGHGSGPAWQRAQRDLVVAVTDALDVDPSRDKPVSVPSRAVQLAFCGAIIMADWIASDAKRFDGIDDITKVSIHKARQRAQEAWQHLNLRGGWRDVVHPAVGDLFRVRFGRMARPIQSATTELALATPAAGLFLVEAPMGEGKTEAALIAAEILAARFGADGVFVGMPTQATSDEMFKRVLEWAAKIDPHTPPGLLHGKRRFNRDWYKLQRQAKYSDIDDRDEYGCSADYGTNRAVPAVRDAVSAPSDWFLGPKRGLLMPVTIGTIDQLLHAATRTRHVMLRYLGLCGRVVILDEVHAYDVYMMQFLTEALRWLGNAAVPVVLLSATLPPSTRTELARAYLQGALCRSDVDVPPELDGGHGYPTVRSVTVVDGKPTVDHRGGQPWRPSTPVTVEILDEGPQEDPGRVVRLVQDALVDGGCALVVRNTVGRAQQTYLALKKAFGGDGREIVLLHARLNMGERVERTEKVLGLLGSPDQPDAPTRPGRLIVVATQLAEQSFDVDVDLLVTDAAPIDLLLQRIGRLHRHNRPAGVRPPRVAAARVVVTGMSDDIDNAPRFPRGSEYVYHRYPLLRAAALVRETAATGVWSVPAQVPDLVRRGYGTDVIEPVEWHDDVTEARDDWRAQQQLRAKNADRFILAGASKLHQTDLAGLHAIPTHDLDDDDAVAAVVRDGPETVEVVMLRRVGDRRYTLDGRSLGISDTGISDPEVAEAVMRSAVRLPPRLTAAALHDLHPLIECGGDAWLGRVRVLELDETNSTVLAGRRLTYDDDLGLLDEPAS